MDTADLLQQAINVLSVGTVYALVAVGVSLTFGLTGMVNFAHGELMMLAAFAVFFVAPEGGVMFIPALVLAAGVGGAVSMGSDRLLFRRTLGLPINGFIVSLGLIYILQNTMIAIEGPNPRYVQPFVDNRLRVGEVMISAQRVMLIVVGGLALAGAFYIINRTRLGLAMRATAVDKDAAGLLGVNVLRTITITFLLGGVLAGLAGGLLSSLVPVTPFLGVRYIFKGFAVALVGGLGSVTGAVYAAFLIGITETVAVEFGYSQWVDVFAFGLMIAILLVRPHGLSRGMEGALA